MTWDLFARRRRIDALEAQVAVLQDGRADAEFRERLTAVEAIAAETLSRSVAERDAGAALAVGVGALEARVAAAEATLGELAGRVDGLASQVDDLIRADGEHREHQEQQQRMVGEVRALRHLLRTRDEVLDTADRALLERIEDLRRHLSPAPR